MGDIKIYDLKTAIKKCNIEYFVETGTLRGDAIDYMLQFNSLKKLISFEIVEQLAREATDRFKGDERVEIVFGDSSKEIENKLKEIKGNAIFWLDAHFPGSDYQGLAYDSEKDEEKRIPLQVELKIISENRDISKDIFNGQRKRN